MNVVGKCSEAFLESFEAKWFGGNSFLWFLDILIMWVMVKNSKDYALWPTSINFFKKSPARFEWCNIVSPASKALSQSPFIRRMLNDRPFKFINLRLSQLKLPSPKEFVQSHSWKQVLILYQWAPFVFLLLMMI
jgi:hypothetical protein